MNVLFKARIFCSFGSTPKMAEGCLVERLHALRRHRDLYAADLKQRHGTEIDVAIARNRSGGPDLSVTELLDLECSSERNDTFWAAAPTEIERDVCAFARAMRSLYRLLIA